MINKEELIEELKLEIEEKNTEINRLNIEYFKVINSRSWKVTKPLRAITYYGKNSRKIFERLKLIKSSNDIGRMIAYDSVYQEDEDYSNHQTDVKAIAFYLPQYHAFKENNEWWGEGFTEWTNMKKVTPRYKDHYQPRVPHKDFGYYDLTDVEVLKKQIELAKKHGLYGFSFYYYWFSGKRLMEKPVDMLLKHPEIDFPFCLCWANENWTRTWDGQEKNVLIAQDYSQKDPVKFIKDIKKYVDDKRYIRIDNKPLILIYNPGAIPDVENVITTWREEARNQGIGEIYVLTRNLILDQQKPIRNCDAEFDFAPLQKGFSSCVLSGVKDSYLFDYQETVREMTNLYKNHRPNKPFYYTSTMGWDNSPRRKEGFTIFHHYSLESFYKWNREIINKTRKMHSKDKRFMFVNAWNEWCEGTYLDPDEKYGYANINTLSKALFDLPFRETKVLTDKEKGKLKLDKKIAVQVHLFHTELIDEIINQLNNIPYSYDCYITTDTEEKKKQIQKQFKTKSNSQKTVIEISENRGRDVAPFLVQISKVYDQYDYICHIHSKKSTTVDYGNHWRDYLYRNLFGSPQNIRQIFSLFEKNEKLGLIYPSVYPVIINQTAYYGNNQINCKKEFRRLGIPINYINEELVFPAGTMFWAKMEAIKPLFEAGYKYSDFNKEAGQLDGTTAHAIERIFCSLAKSRGYTYLNTYNNTMKYKIPKKKRMVLFAHYDEDGKISNEDKNYLKELKKLSQHLVFISNSKVIKKNKTNDCDFIDTWIENDLGFDFGSWQKALSVITEKELFSYDEIVFANNSCMTSHLPLEAVFEEVDKNSVKGLCYTSSLEDVEATYLKSDFMVFPTNILKNNEILNFFKNCEICDSLMDKKEICNIGLTEKLIANDINIDVFIKESKYINQYLVKTPIDSKSPFLMLLLRSPLLNKNAYQYIDNEQTLKIDNFMDQCK